MKHQAEIGGQIGKNGYFYKGGQFLPSTELPPGAWKIGKKLVKPCNELIAPSVIETQPTPFSRSIFNMIRAWVIIKEGKLYLREGIRDQFGEITLETDITPGAKGVLGKESFTLGHLIFAFNDGQRWLNVHLDTNPEYIITK